MKSNKFLWAASIALLVFFGMQQLQAAEGIDVKQAQVMANHGTLLLDVREPGEYSEGHAPSSKLIPLGQLSEHLSELNNYKDKPIAVMCRSGRRSARAVAILQEAGYTQVSNVKGGMNAWESAGLEVVKM